MRATGSDLTFDIPNAHKCAQRGQTLHLTYRTPTNALRCLPAYPKASDSERLEQRIDSDGGKRAIAARFATVEPELGNLRGNRNPNRLTPRGQKKADIPWKLYCMVHNIDKLKIAAAGYEPARIRHINTRIPCLDALSRHGEDPHRT